MAKLKKYNEHSAICPDCNGNGYIKAVLEEGREHVVVQCQTCESEGEIYVDESEVVESYIDADYITDNARKLH
jgi:DnaJ-class molecular chaperone|tara:strand:- start:570 stop:788 length:219 start_codon:yes stop_codon:yes gene_type:complete